MRRETNVFSLHLVQFFLLIFCISNLNASSRLSNDISCDSVNQIVDDLFANTTVDNNEVRELSNQVYNIALNKQCYCLPKVLNLEGFQYYGRNELTKAKELFFQAEGILERTNSLNEVLARNQLFLGLVYVLEHNHESAIRYFLKSKNIFEKINHRIGIADASLNLGLALRNKGDFDEAKEYLLLAYQESTASSKLDLRGYSLQNLTQLYLELEEFDKAIYYAGLTEKTWKEFDYDKGLYYINFIYSNIYKKTGDTESQIHRLHQSIKYAESVEVFTNKHLALLALGEVYKEVGKVDDAQVAFEKALLASHYFTEQQFESLVFNLMEIYEKENDFAKTKYLIKEMLEFNKALINDRAIESNKWVDSENSLENIKSENEELFASKIESEIQLKNQKFLLGFFLLFLSLSIFAAYSFFKQSNIRKRLLEKNRQQNIALFEANEQLEKSTRTIQYQNTKLELKNEELKNFAAIASHDLKSPARTIINFTGLLKRKVKRNAEPEEVLSLVENIEKSSRSMYALIIDLLEYAKLEKAQVNLGQFDANDLVHDLLLDLQSSIEEKNAKIRIENFPLEMVGDSIKLKQVFLNLVNNGMKFIPPEKSPDLVLSCEEESSQYVFHVKDNGIGIEPQFQEKIFSMFQRLNSAEKFEGTGIGLATCKKVIDLHHGEIWVVSDVNEGSTFSFSISKNLKSMMESDVEASDKKFHQEQV